MPSFEDDDPALWNVEKMTTIGALLESVLSLQTDKFPFVRNQEVQNFLDHFHR